MGSTLIILGAMIAGMTCGGGLVGLGIFVYMQWRKSPVLPPPTKRLERATEEETVLERSQLGGDLAALSGAADIYQTVASPPEVSLPWLEGVGGVIAGQSFALYRDEMVMGRSRVCDVQIADPKVSRQHAMIRLYKGHYFLQDMESSRGTAVNQSRVDNHLLKQGDEIRIGDTLFIFHLPK